MNFLSKTLARAATAVLSRVVGEGVYLHMGNSPHLNVPSHYPMNWWQKDMAPGKADFASFGPVAACVSIISQDLSRIPLQHIRIEEDGGRKVVTTKAPARVFRRPNAYQTLADFILYICRSLLYDGNAYCLATRNSRGEVAELYPIHPGACWPYLTEEAEIFYRVSGDPTATIAQADPAEWYPAREVLHIRLQTPKHPLIGETPLVAAVYPTISGTEINRHVAGFFTNMSRPSGILRHPGKLDEAAMARIKDRWIELTNHNQIGEPIVLQEGMDWTQLTMSAVDAELAKSYELTERQIFQIYRVPPFLAGDLQKATFTNVESLTRFYVVSCLSFYETLIEQAFGRFFRLPANEQIIFDVDAALLAGDLKERMEAMGKAIQNGIYSPNEARARENLPPAEHGDEPRVQQQLVPLSFGTGEQAGSMPGVAPPVSGDDGEKSDEEMEASVLAQIIKADREGLRL